MKKPNLLILYIFAFTLFISVVSVTISCVFNKPVVGVVFGLTGIFSSWITTYLILYVIVKK